MADVTHLPPPLEKCTLCADESGILAEVDMVITYRDEPAERYHSKLKLCVQCSEFLMVSRTKIDTQPKRAPRAVNTPPMCSRCKVRPASVLGTSGYRCAECAPLRV